MKVTKHLAERQQNRNNAGNTVQQSWASFQKHYLPEKVIIDSSEAKHHQERGWFRRASAIAAALLLLVTIPVVATALDWGRIFNALGLWAENTFSFVVGEQNEENAPSKTDTVKYESLQDALSRTGEPSDFVPTWIPEGYELVDISISETPKKRIYDAYYVNQNSKLSFFVQTYLPNDPERIEFDGDLIEKYIANGTEYYIFSNMSQVQVAWQTDLYECCITCELEIDVIKKMIDSIGKG